MLSRFSVVMCVSLAVVGRKLTFFRKTSLWHYVFRDSFLLSRRELL